jgi:hypothetical protein
VAVTFIQDARATFTLDGTEYGCQLKNVTLSVEVDGGGSTERVLCGDAIPDPLTFTDRLAGTIVQDWPAPGGGLIGHTRQAANRGKVVSFTLTSTSPAGYTATGKVQLTPLPVTIDPNAPAEADFDWKMTELTETYPAPAALSSDAPDTDAE